MKIYFYLVLLVISLSAFSNEKTEAELKEIYTLMKVEPEAALNLALDLKYKSEESSNKYGIVKANFTIGYILDTKIHDYGKAIVYYLEAIRYAKDFKYEKQYKDLAVLHKNCGVIFRKFKSYGLAEEYYEEAIIYAEAAKNTKEIQSINYNRAGVLMDQKRYSEAINILENLISNSSADSRDYWKYSNRLGLVLFEIEDYESAIEIHNNSLKYQDLPPKSHAYTLHNIGRCYSMLDDHPNAFTHFQKALEIKKQLSDKSLLFSTYNQLGLLSKNIGDIESSLAYFNEAEVYIEKAVRIDHYEVFRYKADILFQIQKFEEAKKYQDLYSDYLNEHLDKQAEIQEADKRYNIDLITKRYFDEVARQERIASILFYSKTISGSLLVLLLLTVGYNRYQQVRLRKSITQELVNLKVVD